MQTTKRVISFSLFGSDPKYWQGARANLELAAVHYPGWICRFYIDSAAPEELRRLLDGPHVEVREMKATARFDGLFWRFLAADDPEVAVMVSRDCDSRLSAREAAAVDEWLASDKDFHLMRDHPYHTPVILGGMWGCRNGILHELGGVAGMMERWSHYNEEGCDQVFLAKRVYPLLTGRIFEHSEFGIRYENPIHPFPTERTDFEFIGDVFDARGRRHSYFWKAIEDPTRPPPRPRLRILLSRIKRRVLLRS